MNEFNIYYLFGGNKLPILANMNKKTLLVNQMVMKGSAVLVCSAMSSSYYFNLLRVSWLCTILSKYYCFS